VCAPTRRIRTYLGKPHDVTLKWVAAIVFVVFVRLVVPRFGWGAAAHERRQSRADAEQVASAIRGCSACEVSMQGPIAGDIMMLAPPFKFWQVRIERLVGPTSVSNSGGMRLGSITSPRIRLSRPV
jgi:hypothetical protein